MDDGIFLVFWHSYYLLIKTTNGTAAYYQIRETNTRLSGSSKLLYHGDKVATQREICWSLDK